MAYVCHILEQNQNDLWKQVKWDGKTNLICRHALLWYKVLPLGTITYIYNHCVQLRYVYLPYWDESMYVCFILYINVYYICTLAQFIRSTKVGKSLVFGYFDVIHDDFIMHSTVLAIEWILRGKFPDREIPVGEGIDNFCVPNKPSYYINISNHLCSTIL